MSLPRHMLWASALILAILALDYAAKRLVIDFLQPGCPPLDATLRIGGCGHRVEVTGFFNIAWVWNFGVSFGMFGDGAIPPWGLKLAAGAIVTALVVWLWRADTKWSALGLALVIGGALGNIIDRAIWGAVYDFLDFHAFGAHFPAFNLADSAITLGVATLIGESFLAAKPKPSGNEDET